MRTALERAWRHDPTSDPWSQMASPGLREPRYVAAVAFYRGLPSSRACSSDGTATNGIPGTRTGTTIHRQPPDVNELGLAATACGFCPMRGLMVVERRRFPRTPHCDDCWNPQYAD